MNRFEKINSLLEQLSLELKSINNQETNVGIGIKVSRQNSSILKHEIEEYFNNNYFAINNGIKVEDIVQVQTPLYKLKIEEYD